LFHHYARGGEEPLPFSYSVTFSRLNNDISFPQNGFTVHVDSTTGKISYYRMNWWNLQFPAADGVLGQETAADIYLEKAPLEIGYMSISQQERYWTKPEIQLVYYMPSLYFEMLDAASGEPLGYSGLPIANPREKNSFTDLVNHPSREAVELLAAYNVVNSSDGLYRPDEVLLMGDLITMLVHAFGRTIETTADKPKYNEYYELARDYMILQPSENPRPSQQVTREELSRYLIRSADMQKAARFGSIFSLDFTDAEDINPELRGFVALSSAMEIIKPTDGNIAPQELVSRGEAAEALVQLLRSRNW
jgi:hypothetical protein